MLQSTQDSAQSYDNRFKINNQHSSLLRNVINMQKYLPSQKSQWMSLWREPTYLRKAAHINTLSYNVPNTEFEDKKLHNVHSDVIMFPTHIV